MAQRFTIRPATEADVDTLVDFTLKEAAEAEGASLSVEAATTGVRGAFETPARAAYWVAVDDTGRIVGSTSIVREWSNFHAGDYWWIQSLYIVPACRGQGLIELVIDHLVEESRSAGALDLRLYVHQSNTRARRAYRRCGFGEAPYLMMTIDPEAARRR